MAQTIKLKRSASQGAVPSISDLDLGEVAINTYDGKMYIKKDDGTSPQTIVEISGTGGVAGGDFNFLDNEKALFGDGSDLQIYHDGSNSYVSDVGIGSLILRGTNLFLQNGDGSQDYITCSNGSAVNIKHAGSIKLTTTATGIDVTGTVTADGLTVDGDARINDTIPQLQLMESDTTDLNSVLKTTAGQFRIQTINDAANSTTNRFIIDHSTGDISFYEDTGTDAKLFWDASAESLGIGTDSPGEALEVVGKVEADEFLGSLRGAILFNAQADEALVAGDVVYISGISGNTTTVAKADADDAAKMPAFGLALAAANLNAAVEIVTFGTLSNIDTSAFSEGDELFVSTTAGGLVNSAPTGESAQIQKMAKVTRSDASAGSVKVMGAGRSNATPNLNTGRLFVGDANNQTVADDTIYVDIANSRVGIGTSSPAYLMHLEDSNGADLALSNSTVSPSAGDYLGRIYALDSTNNFFAGINMFYHDDNDGEMRFRVKTNGTNADVMTLVDGNVGIGTDSPESGLHLFDGTNVRAPQNANRKATLTIEAGSEASADIQMLNASYNHIFFGDAADANVGYFLYDHTNNSMQFATNASERMRIDSSGNVGIGVDAPAQRLDVREENTGGGVLIQVFNTDNANTTTQTAGIALGPDSRGSTARIIAVKENADFSTNAGRDIALTFSSVLNNTPTERMRIDSSGNVGIGTSNPTAPLHVDAAGMGDIYSGLIENTTTDTDHYNVVRFMQGASGSATGYIGTGGSTTGNPAFRNTFVIGTQTSNAFVVATNDTEVMRIDANGNVGIGTTDPDANLQIGDFTGSRKLLLAGANSASDSSQIIFADASTQPSPFYAGMGIRYNSNTNQLIIESHFDTGVSPNNTTQPIVTFDREDQSATFAGTIYTRGAGSLTPDATQPGAIILAKGGSEASPETEGRGIEFLTADVNDGYGHRLVSFDNSGGDTPLILQRRNNNAAWTTQVTFEGNSNNATFAGAISASNLSGTNTGDEPAASTTVAGIVELASITETNTGTDATRAVTPDGLDGWTGSSNVTTLGTIATGTWNGSVIASAYLDSDTAHLSGAQTFSGAKTFSGGIVASGGISGLDLNNGISGTNFNITGVNQLEIADPGEGFVFKAGASGDMTLAIVDDASDNILRYSGTGAVFDVQGNITLTGTVDGRDVATDGTKLDGIEANATADQTQADINALAITQVGTISSGTWNGSVIASAYLDSDTAHLSGTQNFTGNKTFSGGLVVSAASPSFVINDSDATNATDQVGFISFQRGSVEKAWIGYGSSGNSNFTIKNTEGAVTIESNADVIGTLTATSKSFDIEHPTKEGMRLRYGSLEGPENGVYVRGRLSGTEIELPEYWTALVDPDSITVSLTPIGPGSAWVEKIENNRITTGGSENCFYHVFAERVDIDKLVVEYEK